MNDRLIVTEETYGKLFAPLPQDKSSFTRWGIVFTRVDTELAEHNITAPEAGLLKDLASGVYVSQYGRRPSHD